MTCRSRPGLGWGLNPVVAAAAAVLPSAQSAIGVPARRDALAVADGVRMAACRLMRQVRVDHCASVVSAPVGIDQALFDLGAALAAFQTSHSRAQERPQQHGQAGGDRRLHTAGVGLGERPFRVAQGPVGAALVGIAAVIEDSAGEVVTPGGDQPVQEGSGERPRRPSPATYRRRHQALFVPVEPLGDLRGGNGALLGGLQRQRLVLALGLEGELVDDPPIHGVLNR